MPRKKQDVSIRKRYSRDLKRRVIYQARTLGKQSTQIAISLDMPLRVVQRVQQVWDEIGEVCRDRTQLGRALIMSSASVDVRQLSCC
jgi:hypothetical protein